MVCDLSPCLSLTEQQRHLLQQQEQQLQQLLASPQLTPVMPLPAWAASPPPALLEGPSQSGLGQSREGSPRLGGDCP